MASLAVANGNDAPNGNGTTEVAPLLDTKATAAAAVAGATFANQAASKIVTAKRDGPLTFRILGFIGGMAMVISNAIAIPERFFGFHWARAIIAFYGMFFGLGITLLEAPGPCSRYLNRGLRYYCKFLDYTWGRGILYIYCGSLQVSNVNMLDWAVGGFMIFVGFTAIGVGIATARNLRLLHHTLKDEETLKQKWHQYDMDQSGYLDVKELTAFVTDADIPMTRNEIAATFLALDKNFDDKITYEEFYFWWKDFATQGKGVSV